MKKEKWILLLNLMSDNNKEILGEKYNQLFELVENLPDGEFVDFKLIENILK